MEEFESDEEILEFAIGREVSANQFYVDLADQMDNPTMRLLFENFCQRGVETQGSAGAGSYKERQSGDSAARYSRP